YRDIVAVTTHDDHTNYQLPRGHSMRYAQFFAVSVASGQVIRIMIRSPDIVRLTGGEIMDTGADAAIRAIRGMLADARGGGVEVWLFWPLYELDERQRAFVCLYQ